MSATFGSLIGDFVDVVSDVEDFIVDRIADVGDIVGGLPGGDLIVDAANQGAVWVKDIANSSEGTIVLRAMATALYGPLATTLGLSWFGPQMASVVWALPGIARGEKFLQAWTQEFAWRAEKTAEYIGDDLAKEAFDKLGPTIAQLFERLKAEFPGLEPEEALQRLHMTPESLAAEMGIRVDVAALALEYISGKIDIDLNQYDPVTGGPIKMVKSLQKTQHSSAADIAAIQQSEAKLQISLDNAKKIGLPAATIKALETQLANLRAKNEARGISSNLMGSNIVGGPRIKALGRPDYIPPAIGSGPLPQAGAAPAKSAISKSPQAQTYQDRIGVGNPNSSSPLPSSAKKPFVTPESGIGAVGGAGAGFMFGGPVGALIGAVGGFIGGTLLAPKK